MLTDWTAVERWLELPLPADYQALIDAHGPHTVGGVTVEAPVNRPGFDYLGWVAEVTRTYRRKFPLGPADPPQFFPGRAGLLPFAHTANGSVLWWDTASSKDPDQWTTVLLDADTPYGDDPGVLHALSATALISKIAQDTTVTPLDVPSWDVPAAPIIAPARRRALTEGSGLAALTALVPPPAEPVRGGESWEWLFGELGTRLPTEYVRLLDVYGAGSFANGAWHFPDPLSANENGLLRRFRSRRAGYLPFAFMPVDFDELGWITDGEPDEWPVYNRGWDEAVRTPLVDLLLDWLRGGRLFGLGWGLDDPLIEGSFQPGVE